MDPRDLIRTVALIVVREYLFDHPHSALGPSGRRTFSDDYRRFVVKQTRPGEACEGMPVDELAQVTGVDEGTLTAWLRPQ